MTSLRSRVWHLLDGARDPVRGQGLCDGFLIVLILLNVAAVVLESVPRIGTPHADAFHAFEVFSVAVFTIEYLLRLWTAPEDHRYSLMKAAKARGRYVLSPLALIDLLAILPFYFAFLVPVDLRFLRLLRVLRILKLTRYSPALATMATVLRNERNAVFGAMCVLLVLLLISSAAVHLLEHEAQPDNFGSIPQAMWWAITTLTTVGYGDVTPVTDAGRIVGSIVMLLGVGVFVLLTSIFAAGFMEELRKRSFVVTWNLVAKVPVFSGLDALRIAEISGLLKPEIVPPRFTVIRRGEAANAMYFVVSGELEVDLPHQITHVHEGHFIGEMALIDNKPRRATVTALTECQLLRLERADFEQLMRAEPAVREAIEQTARERQGAIDASEI